MFNDLWKCVMTFEIELSILMIVFPLQTLGVTNSSDRSLFKKKIKDMKVQVEKEKKAIAKEHKNREKKEKKAAKKLFATAQ